ncbi:sensor domain-containing diguanylate cyclase [Billgrantia sp. Q4P2]|uniref:sensor domain-containing diguanylate cyclase n=1 Tax=Billgrantia sp. Q4P2 TaxID=3463857 RepID=UPI0040578B9F
MYRHATFFTCLAIVPLVFGVVLGDVGQPLHELVSLGLTGMLVLAKLMLLRGWHATAKTLVGLSLLPLALALASYVLPEYWVPLSRWDDMSHGLAAELTLEAWRPSLLTTLSLILLAILITTRTRSTLGGPLLLIMAALLLGVQGLLGRTGLDTQLLRSAAGPWPTLAMATLLVGLGMAALPGWRAHAAALRRALAPSLILVLAVLLLWHHQKAVTERELHATVETEARQLGDRLTRDIQDHLAAVERFANIWTLFDTPPSQAEWAKQAALYHRDFRYLLNIAFVDPDSRLTRIYPFNDINHRALGARLFDAQPAGREAVSRALFEQRIGRTDVIMLLQGVPGIIHYLPIPLDEQSTLGAVAMVISLPMLAEMLFSEVDKQHTSLLLTQGDQVLASLIPETRLGPWQHEVQLDVAGAPLGLSIQPSHSRLLQQLPRHPVVSLVIGLTLAYLLYLVLHGYTRLARQHRKVHSANTELRREIHTRSQLQQEVEWLARHDELTQLPNRRLFMETLEANATQRPLSVLICDVDHFKRINDHQGHLIGDRYLDQLGGIGREVLEPHGGLFARYGGEEFVACLPLTDPMQAREIAETLRQRLQDAELRHHDGKVLTASIGVVTLVDGPLDVATLMQAADDALYRAKAEGRNRVRVAPALTIIEKA